MCSRMTPSRGPVALLSAAHELLYRTVRCQFPFALSYRRPTRPDHSRFLCGGRPPFPPPTPLSSPTDLGFPQDGWGLGALGCFHLHIVFDGSGSAFHLGCTTSTCCPSYHRQALIAAWPNLYKGNPVDPEKSHPLILVCSCAKLNIIVLIM